MSAAVAEKVILGKTLAIDADGNLVNLSDWNEDIANELAKEEGIEVLNAKHWQVINYMHSIHRNR